MHKKLTQWAAAGCLLATAWTANAADLAPLTPAQLVGESTFTVLLAADYKQTRQIPGFCAGRQGCSMHETNPLLGHAPDPARIRNYFLTAAIAHATVTLLLPSGSRAAWLGSTIALEAVVVGRNKRLGLRCKF